MPMKILQRKIIHDIDSSFSLVTFSSLRYPLHYHDEYELILITSGTGREYVGHAVEKFRAGELTLIGKGVPHVHLCDSVTDAAVKTESTCEILYFPSSLFPEDMAKIEEYRLIQVLLEKSRCGVRFTDSGLTKTIHGLMKKIRKTSGLQRFQVLLSILDRLSCARQTALISPLPVLPEKKPFADAVTRIQTCLKESFTQTVTLKDIAGRIGMNAHAMCRLFKRETGKTVFQYLSRIRIDNACRLLIETGWPVSRIAWESGYANLSHFNRQFRQLTGQTPSGYKQSLATHFEKNPDGVR